MPQLNTVKKKNWAADLQNRELDLATYEELARYLSRNVHTRIESAPAVIFVRGQVVATIGNFTATIGKAKHGKTFNVLCMAASAISGKIVLEYEVRLPEGKNGVLYFDTEQGDSHFQDVIDRIDALSGMALTNETTVGYVEFFTLRELTHDQRIKFIEWTLQKHCSHVGFVIIDGLKDLMLDINNNSESTLLSETLMRWTSYYEIALHTVLHENKNDPNARGAIGTEVFNKAETILQVKRHLKLKYSEVRPVMCRNKEFEPFAFYVDDAGLPQLNSSYLAVKKKRPGMASITSEQHYTALSETFADGDITSHKDLVVRLTAAYANIGYKRGRTWITELHTMLKELGAITECSSGKSGHVYHYDTDFQFPPGTCGDDDSEEDEDDDDA